MDRWVAVESPDHSRRRHGTGEACPRRERAPSHPAGKFFLADDPNPDRQASRSGPRPDSPTRVMIQNHVRSDTILDRRGCPIMNHPRHPDPGVVNPWACDDGPENDLAHLAGQRPIPYQPGPPARVGFHESIQGLKARSISLLLNDHQPVDRAYSPQGNHAPETQPVGPGWYVAGPLALNDGILSDSRGYVRMVLQFQAHHHLPPHQGGQ